MAFKFECFFPAIPGETEMMMLQGMTYKATLTLAEDVDPRDLQVEAWTSQCDKDNPDGDWHTIRLPYLGAKECGAKHEYGVTEVITSDKDFHFTFRAKCTGPGYVDRDWVWSHPFGVNGFATVLPCRIEDKWTQESNYDHICGSVHLGNFIAATHAKENGFTHVINVAETLDVVFPNKDVVYRKVFIKDGAHNPIEDEKLLDAVHWIKQHDVSGNKLLLNCRAGIGRAGSVAVAYVYYTNPKLSYDDAYNYCFKRRFVYPHARLQERIEQVFPRYLFLNMLCSLSVESFFSCHDILHISKQKKKITRRTFFQKTPIRTFYTGNSFMELHVYVGSNDLQDYVKNSVSSEH